MIKQIHPKLYQLLIHWYDQPRPHQKLTEEKLLDLWVNLWFSKKEKMKQNDKQLQRFESTILELLDYEPISTIDRLGYIILYDQIPRNIYRGDPRAYLYDEKARTIAKAIRNDTKVYEVLPLHFKITLCICLLHSENLTDQEQNKGFIDQLKEKNNPIVQKALQQLWFNHWDRVRLFSRIPERNSILGRESTLQEQKYLQVMSSLT